MSFGPGHDEPSDGIGESDHALSTRISKKHAISEIIDGDVSRRSVREDEDRPIYSKDYLDQLRNSTPSTPRDLPSYASEDDETAKAVDIVSKFGVVDGSEKAIPSHAEIQEKKERRARLAKEQDFISLDNDDDGRCMQLAPHKKSEETRLVRDDEDIAEGFDDYVEDPGHVTLGKKANAMQQRKFRDEMRDLIDDAEADSDEDESEVERNDAYESAQTRRAMDGLRLKEESNEVIRRVPTVITPIPRLSTVLERLRAKVATLEQDRDQCSRRMSDLQQERAEIAAREVDIQRLLQEAGEKYQLAQDNLKRNGMELEGDKNQARTERGLDTVGER